MPLIAQAYPPDNSLTPPASQLSSSQLNQLAQTLTVKVFAGKSWGSGTLIHKQGETYTILTNAHVLTSGDGTFYRIQTPDGQVYTATVQQIVGLKGSDVGILQFHSPNKIYAIATLNRSKIIKGDSVIAAGFPFNRTGWIFTTGQIALLLDKPLEGGYQLGYTNDIYKGMSGGPVLNLQGELVGINGRHAYPLWGNGYEFQDGSQPTEQLQEQLIRLSWAISVTQLTETFNQLEQINHEI